MADQRPPSIAAHSGQATLQAGTIREAALLDQFPDPVILLNGRREVLFANAAAADVLSGTFAGRDLAVSFRHPAVLEAADAIINGKSETSAEIDLSAPVQRSFRVRAVAVDISPARVMLVFQDVTGAKAAEEIRADFVANVSHELRSPISSLVGFIETLQGPAKDDAEAQERFLAMMAEEAQRMSRLINDLLSLSHVETSEHVRPRGQVDIEEVLRSTAELLGLRAQEKGKSIEITIDSDKSDGLPAVMGDHDELIQVFHNLLDNAVKYSRPDTAVRAIVTPNTPVPGSREPGLSIAVSDQGEGIAAEHLPRLTERFYRVDKGRSRQMGGTGLGLAIVKHIISRHRGHLAISSKIGEGTTFTVYLPVFRPSAPGERG